MLIEFFWISCKLLPNIKGERSRAIMLPTVYLSATVDKSSTIVLLRLHYSFTHWSAREESWGKPSWKNNSFPQQPALLMRMYFFLWSTLAGASAMLDLLRRWHAVQFVFFKQHTTVPCWQGAELRRSCAKNGSLMINDPVLLLDWLFKHMLGWLCVSWDKQASGFLHNVFQGRGKKK